jgi:phasin family protein
MAAAAKASMEESLSAFKALSSVKSLKEAFELQTAYARSTLEKTVAESSKLTDASFKLTEQALAPITARVTVAVEKFSKTA